MSSAPRPSFNELAASLSATLKALKTASRRKASAEEQLAAFRLGCETLTKLLAVVGDAAKDLENVTSSVAAQVSSQQLESFIDGELDLLRKLKLAEEDMEDTRKRIKRMHKEDGLENLEVNVAETIETLEKFKDILCGIEQLNAKGRAVDPELVSLCLDGALDTVLVVGDIASVPAAVAAGPAGWGGLLLAAASVAGGVRSLRKVIAKARELLAKERASQKASETADQKRAQMRRNYPATEEAITSREPQMLASLCASSAYGRPLEPLGEMDRDGLSCLF